MKDEDEFDEQFLVELDKDMKTLDGLVAPAQIAEIRANCLAMCLAHRERMREEPLEDRMGLLQWLLDLARTDRDTYRLIREAMWVMRVDHSSTERSRYSVCPRDIS